LEAVALDAPPFAAPPLDAPDLAAPPPLEGLALLAAVFGGAALVVDFIGLAVGLVAVAVVVLAPVVFTPVVLAPAAWAVVAFAPVALAAGFASDFFDVAILLPPEIFATIAIYRFIKCKSVTCMALNCFHCNVELFKLQ
jgi:hypothetical protein